VWAWWVAEGENAIWAGNVYFVKFIPIAVSRKPNETRG